jgi:hypothetical protein
VEEVSPEAGGVRSNQSVPDGWCAECIIENIRENFGTKRRTATSRDGKRSDRHGLWDRDRRRVHRLRRMIRPWEPAPVEDPWELGYAALTERRSSSHRSRRAQQLERVETIEELIRRLAFGAGDLDPFAEPERDVRVLE